MIFRETPLAGAVVVELEPLGDERGFFARTFCAREFAEHGLNSILAQSSISYSAHRGTLRGLHFQASPAMEDKLVRCLRGAIFDVMVDIRLGSPTFGRWLGVELSEDSNLQLYAAQGFAHGFQALTEDVVVSYHIGQFYEQGRSTGIRWDDPEIGVTWPMPPVEQSLRDLKLPLLRDVDPDILMRYQTGVPAS